MNGKAIVVGFLEGGLGLVVLVGDVDGPAALEPAALVSTLMPVLVLSLAFGVD